MREDYPLYIHQISILWLIQSTVCTGDISTDQFMDQLLPRRRFLITSSRIILIRLFWHFYWELLLVILPWIIPLRPESTRQHILTTVPFIRNVQIRIFTRARFQVGCVKPLESTAYSPGRWLLIHFYSLSKASWCIAPSSSAQFLDRFHAPLFSWQTFDASPVDSQRLSFNTLLNEFSRPLVPIHPRFHMFQRSSPKHIIFYPS